MPSLPPRRERIAVRRDEYRRDSEAIEEHERYTILHADGWGYVASGRSRRCHRSILQE